jgi:DNA-binding protein H-NS
VPGYPYEQLTGEQVAHVQRLRDKQTDELRQENRRLADDLYTTKQRLRQLLDLFEEAGIDEETLLATAKIFEGPNG